MGVFFDDDACLEIQTCHNLGDINNLIECHNQNSCSKGKLQHTMLGMVGPIRTYIKSILCA